MRAQAERESETIKSVMQDRLTRTYQRDSTDVRVAVADGYGIAVKVSHGQLVIEDGLGVYRRTREYTRVERALKRIIIIGSNGYVSLGALAWCRDVGVSVVNVGKDAGDLATTSPGPDDARLRRAQAFTGDGGPYAALGLDIAKRLLARKLAGHAEIARDVLKQPAVAETIEEYADQLRRAESIVECRGSEGHAAASYWEAWSGRVGLPWKPTDHARVPAHWRQFTTRSTATSEKSRGATDPINAMLNYCYRIAEIECRLACLATGLDPAFGYMHVDKENRDSLAVDLLEVVRPHIERYVLTMLGYGGKPRAFTPRDFAETRDGTCRITSPLSHELVERCVDWARVISPVAEELAVTLSDVAEGHVRIGRPTQDKILMRTRQPSARRESAQSLLTVQELVPDNVWEQVRLMLPSKSHGQGGRPPSDVRAVLAGIVCVELLGKTWHKIPRSLNVSRHTCRRRLDDWRELGVWETVRPILAEHVHAIGSRLPARG